jgi:serine/threonine protein kinase
MGEVYRAHDTRLGRDVAIKTLLQIEPERKARLEREARAAAVLNHPNICTLHDVGEYDGVPYLVMEFIDGRTLDQRLESGAMGLEEALSCGIEVARALEHAHAHGIVHRDLKPANIMLTKSGAKVLDFGLAKTAHGAGSILATATQTQLTAEGAIAGTLQYMAPEQLEGREAGPCSDVFAFGAVLYEMLTGRRAFDGESPASIVSAIMTASPTPVADLLPLAPPALDRAVRKCLARDPAQRWQTVTDLRDELEWIRAEAGRVRTTAAPRRRAWLPWIAVAARALGSALARLI